MASAIRFAAMPTLPTHIACLPSSVCSRRLPLRAGEIRAPRLCHPFVHERLAIGLTTSTRLDMLPPHSRRLPQVCCYHAGVGAIAPSAQRVNDCADAFPHRHLFCRADTIIQFQILCSRRSSARGHAPARHTHCKPTHDGAHPSQRVDQTEVGSCTTVADVDT